MDATVLLLVQALAKNPEIVTSAAKAALKPGVVDIAKMQGSLVDLSKGILTCYHKSARFRQADILGTPWNRASQYDAERSAVLRIRFEGVSRTQYEMNVAVMAKGTAVRSHVIYENTIVRYNKKCELEEWSTPK